MSPDDLAAAFEDLARVDPEIRIDGTRVEDGTVTASLAAGGSHPESWRRFCSHAIDAARLFDPDGQGDPVERWLSLVWKNSPELISGDLLGGMIKDAASASAIVVRRLSARIIRAKRANVVGQRDPRRNQRAGSAGSRTRRAMTIAPVGDPPGRFSRIASLELPRDPGAS